MFRKTTFLAMLVVLMASLGWAQTAVTGKMLFDAQSEVYAAVLKAYPGAELWEGAYTYFVEAGEEAEFDFKVPSGKASWLIVAYGDRVALKDMDLEVYEGKRLVAQDLGPDAFAAVVINTSGKTTLTMLLRAFDTRNEDGYGGYMVFELP